MAMTVEGFKPSQFQESPCLCPIEEGFLGFGVFVAPMQEHKSSDELPSNSETVEPDGHPPSGVYGKFGVQVFLKLIVPF
uniref:Uncharacterized protein n=1 Tax=Oryza meridionalis TaxID=40149 RepID=A0A0E0E9C2_9ORYZ